MDTLKEPNITEIVLRCQDYLLKSEQLDKQIIDETKKLSNEELEIKSEELAVLILSKASSSVRAIAKTKIEEIVTNALQFVAQDNTIKFIIEESVTRSKPSYEFYIETQVNGVPSLQKPIDACGGGFVDIISVTLQYAYCEIYDMPAICNDSWLLDEAGKMISEQMSIKFAEYVKFLGSQFGKQTIMITHKEDIANVADQTYLVTKDGQGVSHVNDYSINTINLNIEETMKDLEELLDEE